MSVDPLKAAQRPSTRTVIRRLLSRPLSTDRDPLLGGLSGRLDPVRYLESGDALEVFRVIRHQNQAARQGMRRDERVERADGLTPPCQCTGHRTEPVGRRLIERQHRHRQDERIDDSVQFAGRLGIGTKPQFGQGDRTDAELGWPVFEHVVRHAALAPQGAS